MLYREIERHAALFEFFDHRFRRRDLRAGGEKLGNRRVALRCRARHGMLGGHRHIGHTQQGVGARGVDLEIASAIAEGELDLQAFGTANPVALHGLDRFRPALQPVQIGQ